MIKSLFFAIFCWIFSAIGVVDAQEAVDPPATISSANQDSGLPRAEDSRWRAYAREAWLSPAPVFATVMPALSGDIPEYGDGWEGFGRRLGRRAGQYQLQTALYHASASVLGTDSAYRRCTCTGVARRLGYALSRTVVTRTRSGTTVPNAAYLGGVFGGAAIATEAWYPDRYRASAEGLRTGAVQVGVTTAVNVIQEFGPELKRLFRR